MSLWLVFYIVKLPPLKSGACGKQTGQRVMPLSVFSYPFFLQNGYQIFPIIVFGHIRRQFSELGRADISEPEGDLFNARYFQSLAFLDGLHIIGSLVHRFMSPGVQPCQTSSQNLNPEIPSSKINQIDIRYLEFSPGRRLEVGGNIDDIIVINVKAGYGIMGFWFLRFFLNSDHPPLRIEFHHAVSFRILYRISENKPAFEEPDRGFQDCRKTITIKYVVPEDQEYGILSDKRFSDNKGLSQSFR